MKKTCLLMLPAWLAFAGSLHAQPSPGVVYDLKAQFDTNANPSISGWSYNEGLSYGGGLISQTIDPNWNQVVFGPGQPGYDGTHNPGTYAGWAQRIDTGNIGSEPGPGGPYDDPVGNVIGYDKRF